MAAASGRVSSTDDLDGRSCDLVVVGSGAAGLSCAIVAARAGLEVVLLERDEALGGTAARSGGWMWLPGNRGAAAEGDTSDAAFDYLEHLSDGRCDRERVSAFLESCRPMLDFMERHTALAFDYPTVAPDYQMAAPGARRGGRAISAAPFDARALGDSRRRLASPLSEMTVFGVMPQIGEDLDHFVRANRSARSFAYVLARIFRNTAERVRYGRGLGLSNGAALAGRLLSSAVDAGVDLRAGCSVERIDTDGQRVTGVLARSTSGSVRLQAREGVVLACGGISHDVATRQRVFPHDASESNHVSAVAWGNDGGALRLAAPLGGELDDDVIEPAAWAPVTVFRGVRGRRRIYPHLRGIGLPGIIAVDRHGRRFTNESNSYHDFGQALRAANHGEPDDVAYLICDAATMHRYGIGYAKPWPMPRLRYLRNGYLTRAKTPQALALSLGIDPAGLQQTLAKWNPAARKGEDPAYGRGATEYNFFRGDRSHEPNPCLAPVEKPPFYGVPVRLGDLGAFAGLRTDASARVTRADTTPIAGLYAVGSAATSPFGGAYPGYGAMLGPGMVFGYLAARHVIDHHSEGTE